MCLYPRLVKNPNYGLKNRYSFMKDTVSEYIKVPCGVCSECIAVKQLSLVQRCLVESQFGYPFFATLTYNNESLPHIDTSTGYSFRYADMKDFSYMVKRIRKDNLFSRPFRYFAVSELGEKRARPHIHALFFLQKFDSDNLYTPYNLEKKLYDVVLNSWSRNIGTNRKPIYKPLCTYVRKFVSGQIKSTYDLHYVCPSSVDGTTSDVTFYVTKYMLKPNDKVRKLQQALHLNLDAEEYISIWNIVKPRWISSLNFGFGLYGLQCRSMSFSDRLNVLSNSDSFKLVRKSIDRSLAVSDRPLFYDPESGKSFPLSRYYKSFGNLYTPLDATHFYYVAPDQRADNVNIDERDLYSKFLSEEAYKKHLRLVDEHQDNYDFLFD